ncbi:MAG: galactofuranose transport system substrate-binding protein [Acidobacteriota bacterium]|jgi:ribose transport system substrate-binding protein|nr:galactofuranose transport system substrate-binding protein [Acidobacteriota bacterium]
MKNFINSRKLIVILTIAAISMMAFSDAGCAKKGSRGGSQGKLKVGFSQMEENNPWRIAETNSLRDEAKKRGDKFDLVVTNAQGQTSKQVSDVEDLIAQRVDAIFLAPREFEGLSTALQRAKEAKIPVFLIDREAAGTAGQDFVAFLGSNFVEQGRRAGEWLVKQTNGKAGIVELTGTAGASVARDRSQGFRDAIQNSPDMKILTSQTGDFSRAEGQKVMENIIQAQGKAITAVYAHNDEMALGAIQALKAAGMNPGKDVLIVSVDGEKAGLEAITRGEMNITVESNPRFGPLAFDTLEKYLRKESIPPKIILEDKFFDTSNAAQFVNDAY